MLPQGMFSVAVATVLFPQLARLAARKDDDGLRATTSLGLRQIALLLIPAGAAMRRSAADRARLCVRARRMDGGIDRATADALFWFAFSLPFSGFVLMLTRAFFSLQRPWVPTTLAVGSLAINAILSYVLAEEFGIAGIVIGTAVSNAALVVAEAIWLGGLDIRGPARRHAAWRGGAGRRRVWGLVPPRRPPRAGH